MPKIKIRKYIDDIQNLTNSEIPLTEIAKILIQAGVSAQDDVKKLANNLSNRLFNDGFLKDEEISVLDNHYKSKENLIIINDNTIEKVTLDYYPDLDFSCGNGLMPLSGTKEQMTIPTSLIKGYRKERKYIIVNAKSDSMMPEIKPNDLLIIRIIDTEPIIDNHIYIFCYDERLYCKYLSWNIHQIIVRSANPDYKTQLIEKENINLFRLYGEVVGHFRSYNI